MATTVTLTADVPANLADSLGLAATDRQAGDVLSLPHGDALALVQNGVASFGSAAEDAARAAAANRSRVRGYPVTPDAGTAIAASGTLTGETVALGDQHRYERARLLVVQTQAGTAVIEQAMDAAGPWFRPTAPAAVAANTPLVVEDKIVAPFLRAVVTNGSTTVATAPTRAFLSLISA